MQNQTPKKEKNPERARVFEKIEELELAGLFDRDVESDPPSAPLTPERVNYLNRGFFPSLRRDFAFLLARRFFKKVLSEKKIILDKTVGAENIKKCQGAVITCNHVNPFDSFIMQYVFDESKHGKRMYRVIKEGNYTSFPGFYGFLMRNCNTLPLGSSKEVMHMFLEAADTALQGGSCILIYPEQSMWYNYRKPRPLKSGAFDIAVRNNVPVIPSFITMRDSEYTDGDGYPVQIYKPFIGEPIYPDESLPRGKRACDLLERVYGYTKRVYESFYGIPLVYSCDEGGKTR